MVVSEGIVRDLLRLLVWYPLRWVVQVLPVGAGLMLFRAMGDMHYALSRGKRQRLFANLSDTGLDACNKHLIVREYFRNHYVDRLFIFIVPGFGSSQIRRYVELEGVEHLEDALGRGKGVVLVHGHFGPVHMPLVVLARCGFRIKQLGLPSDDGLSWIGRNVAYRLRLRYEAKIPAEILRADSFLRPVFVWLAHNGCIMTTGDGTGTQQRLGKYESFTFLGRSTAFPLGPATLAKKTTAAFMPVFITPAENNRYRITIEPPLNPLSQQELSAAELTALFVQRLETYVRRYPGLMHFLDRL
ncbi:MAG: lysophospholipid acyltransferase family protein [Candidatus Magnetobacterium sp. LHC-1]|uniref:Lysophospholipid acyltransferase family protein n=1 Tax=Candidatus Magnetobacterium casense TaxID=1455061 RepID=A0ABS6RTZ5_9BACT|nr:lysophospholipid acyltransferase family protein [Candidatus Magnetobacterium casensis]MBF0608105.1 lysophospholipid acyltransferase family protein [Nitrospirota bacterium]MBV6340099.1 lysophospholipid acyltransferase family protein [Candidatus Magnetobacterium casensis]